MRSAFKKVGIAAVGALLVVGVSISASTTADAHYRGWGGGWAGPAFIGGFALGALAAPRPYYGYGGGYGYGYSYPAYSTGYYGGDECFLRRRVVGYDYYGRPIVRARRVCY